jgi:hypothetical protein
MRGTKATVFRMSKLLSKEGNEMKITVVETVR